MTDQNEKKQLTERVVALVEAAKRAGADAVSWGLREGTEAHLGWPLGPH